ncbi:MAG: leucine-rich repeat domain-containing protein [Cytophagaceae bacterium]|nr:leucine-rich repeat domain-containing protein [Cytophagaceae bacterium]MBK9936483.1 leucine-rich repeat domain-containing protein [Cytophagaceae bacterium]MBL0300233.1 leucine-rich repeat domain-containing protein [Cytophagaceae bacterium]MBL0327170.1 leucine-rich repeat domain-containing protein [Cytophagaceae bacterium]
MRTKLTLFFFLTILQFAFSQKIIFKDTSAVENKHLSKAQFEEDKTLKIKIALNFGKLLRRELVKTDTYEQFSSSDYLNYELYFNDLQKVDSVEFHLSSMQINPSGNSRSISNNKADFTDIQKVILEKAVKNCLNEYKNKTELLRPIVVSGSIMLNFNNKPGAKTVEEYLAGLNSDVKEINLSGYGLKKLPGGVYNFKKLENLNLSKNQISELKINTRKIPHLKTLDLSDNYLSDKSLKIRKNSSVKVLNLTENGIDNLNKKWLKNKNMTDLVLANNSISTFSSKNIRYFKKIQVLNLYNNYVNTLPENFGELNKLQILDLYHNNLRDLPVSFSKLESLQTLAVSNNKLWDFPAGFSNLINLKTLYAHHNKLSNLPEIPPNLELLDLGFNMVKTLPAGLKNCVSLTDLDVSNNQLSGNFGVLKELNSLKLLYILTNNWEANEGEMSELKQIIVDLRKKSVQVK